MTVTEIKSNEDFLSIINSGKPVVIDFWAAWCGPCRFISPVLETLSENEEFADVGFYKVNVDEEEQISQEVGIRAMPTFKLFQNGNKVDELVGSSPSGLEVMLCDPGGERQLLNSGIGIDPGFEGSTTLINLCR
ncbi:hypothetical protein H0H93_016328 [Arthromyces matolae]|nr:hypothetical protein H0H93_016328 [Arthromyces matolae]